MAGDIEIAGIRTRFADPKAALKDLQAFARSCGGWAQLLDAGHVVGRDHITSAHEHARRAIERGTNATGSIEMELLLYASGERQISRAIERMGVRAGRPSVAVLGGGVSLDDVRSRFGWTTDDSLLRPTRVKLRALGCSDTEIRTAGNRAVDMALERVARVDLVK